MSLRIPLPRDEDLDEEVRATLGSLPALHVFRMMANAPANFRPFLSLAGSVLVASVRSRCFALRESLGPSTSGPSTNGWDATSA
jgi:hypothetical protein